MKKIVLLVIVMVLGIRPPVFAGEAVILSEDMLDTISAGDLSNFVSIDIPDFDNCIPDMPRPDICFPEFEVPSCGRPDSCPPEGIGQFNSPPVGLEIPDIGEIRSGIMQEISNIIPDKPIFEIPEINLDLP